MDISKMSLQELKALAYDLIAQRDAIQANLQIVNQTILEKSKKEEKAAPPVEGDIV